MIPISLRMNIMKKPSAALAVVATALALTACGASPQGSGKTHVVAASYPFAFIAESVGGTQVHVDNLTAPGVEPHDLELKPKQVGAVQDADLVIFEKSFQAAVDQAVDQADRASTGTIDVASLVTPLSLGNSMDPHLWLDPLNMIAITKAVEAKLSDLDPDHARTYAANAKSLTATLAALDADFTAGLKACRTRTIVTSHAAFQYLAHRYGLRQIAIAGIDPSNEPALSQLATLTELVRTQHITTIFTEELVSPAIAQTLARAADVTTAVLDPIEGLSKKTAGENYVSLMTQNLAAIRKANTCS